MFDDAKIREIGDWNDVKVECVKSRYQPVLLLYELVIPDELTITPSKTKEKSNFDKLMKWKNSRFFHSPRGIFKIKNLEIAEPKIKFWGRRHKQKIVQLTYPLGINLGFNENKDVVVLNFIRQMPGDYLLSAERSGQVDLLDRLIDINGKSVQSMTVNEVARYIIDHRYSGYSITLESEDQYELWYTCQSCGNTTLTTSKQADELMEVFKKTSKITIPCQYCTVVIELT